MKIEILMSCYCGLAEPFATCCQPFINGIKFASTAEQLMRSRYSAYATKASDYLFHTTASGSQQNNSKKAIKEWAEQTQWLQLTIEKAESINLSKFDPKRLPAVQFTALYLHQRILYKLTECSFFTVEHQHWKYVSGNILVDCQLTIPKRNEFCFCGSEKKFKRCCSSKLSA